MHSPVATVSVPYGEGKQSFWKQVSKNEELKDISLITMNDHWAVQDDVSETSSSQHLQNHVQRAVHIHALRAYLQIIT